MIPSGPAVRRGDVSDLPTLPPLPPVPTAAERAAAVIRENIFEGRFTPGAALPEAALSKALQVSRNTVREAFRALTGEHLLTYAAHKGVVVRWLTADDVDDIYRLRRMLELGALDLAIDGRLELDVGEIDKMVTAAEHAVRDGRWKEVGTADLRFHAEIVSAHRSPRIDEVFQRLMTEMRLGFLAITDQAALHGQFVSRNRGLHGHIAAGRLAEARQELAGYLDDSQELIVKAVRESAPARGQA
jgi:DNA-binding GntR family transcriptional regulator